VNDMVNVILANPRKTVKKIKTMLHAQKWGFNQCLKVLSSIIILFISVTII